MGKDKMSSGIFDRVVEGVFWGWIVLSMKGEGYRVLQEHQQKGSPS